MVWTRQIDIGCFNNRFHKEVPPAPLSLPLCIDSYFIHVKRSVSFEPFDYFKINYNDDRTKHSDPGTEITVFRNGIID